MNDKTASKPQVSFHSAAGWLDYGDRGLRAVLRGISGHPRLGQEPIVNTSRVERVVYDDNGLVKEVITKNTHYIRKQEKNHG